MPSSEAKKVLKYIKSGSVSKLRHFVRKNNVDLNKIRDSEMRGVLHLAAFLGDGKIMKCLLRCGANPCLFDSQGNTAMHTAIDYVFESNSEKAFVELVMPLKRKFRRMMRLKNKEGQTCEQRFRQLKDVLRRNLALDKGSSDDDDDGDGYGRNTVGQHCNLQDRSGNQNGDGGCNSGYSHDDNRQQSREEELEWREKLAFEESCEDFYFKEDGPEVAIHTETYNEWADRIRREYKAKRVPKMKPPTKQVEEQRNNYEDLTRKLANDHEEYVEKTKSKIRQKILSKERKEYERKCCDVFDQSCNNTMLSYWDIPWPCHGNAADMVDKLSAWSQDDDKVRYLKEQRIRWHPDRFLHRCKARLQHADNKLIVDLVKQLSQGINVLLESL